MRFRISQAALEPRCGSQCLDQIKFHPIIGRFLIDIAPSIDTQGRDATAFTPYYFSFVTFTTLGFGDVLPKNLAGELWLTLEVVLGYVMLGGLISIFATKVSRRAA